MTNEEILEKVHTALTSREMMIPSEATLKHEIENARLAINIQRRVKADTAILPEHVSVWVELCIEAISKYGAEGETSHSENGIGRGYDNASPYSMATLSKIIPRIGVI